MSKIFDSIKVSEDIKRFIDHSFDIVEQIHIVLEKQGKSQKDLAELLGKKESEISKWMQGTHNFTIKSIAKIEAVLEVNILTTPHKAIKPYSKTKIFPVSIHAHINMPHIKEEVNSEPKKWINTGTELYKNGLRSA